MESNELKIVNIKNRSCYYFDDMIKIEDFHLGNILLDEKSYGSVSIYDILYKQLIGPKPYLLEIKHLVSQETSIAYVFPTITRK